MDKIAQSSIRAQTTTGPGGSNIKRKDNTLMYALIGAGLLGALYYYSTSVFHCFFLLKPNIIS